MKEVWNRFLHFLSFERDDESPVIQNEMPRRVGNPNAQGYRTNNPIDVAMEDDAFVKFYSHTKCTANYLMATRGKTTDEIQAVNTLIADAYEAGKNIGHL